MKTVGQAMIVKCQAVGFDFIPCCPALRSVKTNAPVVTRLYDGQKLIFTGKTELNDSVMYGFYCPPETSETENLPAPVYVGEGLLPYIYAEPKKRKPPRRHRRVGK